MATATDPRNEAPATCHCDGCANNEDTVGAGSRVLPAGGVDVAVPSHHGRRFVWGTPLVSLSRSGPAWSSPKQAPGGLFPTPCTLIRRRLIELARRLRCPG